MVDNPTDHQDRTLLEGSHTEGPKPTDPWYFRKTAIPIPLDTPYAVLKEIKTRKEKEKEDPATETRSPNAVVHPCERGRIKSREENRFWGRKTREFEEEFHQPATINIMMHRKNIGEIFHDEMEGTRGWVESEASFIASLGPMGSALPSGEVLGVLTPSVLAAGPEPGVEGDFCDGGTPMP